MYIKEKRKQGTRSVATVGQAGVLPATVFLMVSVCASEAFAQRSEEALSANQSIEEVLVTATRREKEVVDIPISVSAMSGRELEARSAVGLRDFIQSVPGVALESNSASGNQVTIRGIAASATGVSALQKTTVGYYVNDVPVSDNPQATGEVALFDMRSVEISRGPQGTLFGEGAPGGVIRYLTNKPNLEGFEARVAGQYFEQKDGGSGHMLNGMLNLANSEGTFAARLVASRRDDDGWVDALIGPTLSELVEDANASENTTTRVSLLWQISNKLTVEAMWMSGDTEQEDGSSRVQEETLTRPSPIPNFSESDYDLYNLTFTWDLPWAAFTSSSNFLDQSGFIFFTFPSVPNVQAQEDTSSIENFVQEFRLVSTGDGPLRWVAGAFYKDQEREVSLPLNIIDISQDPWSVNTFFFINNVREYQQWAGFGEVEWDATDRFTLTLGARYTNEELDYVTDQEDFVGFFFPTFRDVGEDSYSDFTPKLSAMFEIREDSNIYATIVKGFRGPGVKNFYTGGESTFDAESVWSYEIGFKSYANDRAWYFAAAAYYNDWTDLQIPTQLFAAPWNVEITNGEAESRGFEFEANAILNDNWRVGGTYSYVDTELLEYSTNPNFEGNQLLRIPEHTWSLFADARYPIGGGRNAYFRADYVNVGESFSEISNAPGSELDGYGLLNVRLGVNDADWEVFLFSRNLTDEFIAYSGNQSTGYTAYGPRMIGIGGSFEF